jgi:hypothetical protein
MTLQSSYGSRSAPEFPSLDSPGSPAVTPEYQAFAREILRKENATSELRESAPTPSEIWKKVHERRQHPGFVSLFARFEKDWSLLRLNEHKTPTGYQSYTSNRPKTTLDKIIAWMSEANMVVRTSRSDDNEANEAGSMLEMFFRGCMRMNNYRLNHTMVPELQDYLGWSIAARGWYIGRAMFNNVNWKGTKFTSVEVEPWDPLHMAWDVDKYGTDYIARVMRMTPNSLKRRYGAEMLPAVGENNSNSIEVIEYLDREHHVIVGPDEFITDPFQHHTMGEYGEPCLPGFLGFQGATPFIQGIDSEDTNWEDVGESVMSQIRHTVDIQNRSMSDWMTLVRRAVKHPLIITSKTGKTRLLGDPYREGANINLKEGESLELAPEMKMLADANAFIGVVGQELDQGSLSPIHFGNSPFQLSGVAQNILKNGAQHQVMHRFKALGAAHRQIGNALKYGFLTGRYDVLQLQGNMGPVKAFFDKEFQPEMLAEAGFFDVSFKNQLGFEDPQMFATAQMMREGEIPLAPDEYIWSEMLDVEDVDGWKASIDSQQAQRNDPKSLLVSLTKGLQTTGHELEAQFYMERLKKMLLSEKRAEFMEKMDFQIRARQILAILQQGGDDQGALRLLQEMVTSGVGNFAPSPQQSLPQGPSANLGSEPSILTRDAHTQATAGLTGSQGTSPNAPVEPGRPRPGAQGMRR